MEIDKMSRFGLLPTLSFVAALFAGAGAHAVTVSESDLGEFSGEWSSPTELGAGIDGVSGTGAQNQFDILVLTGLTAGAQTLTFTFTGPADAGDSYAAGGTLMYSFDAFQYGWDGDYAGSFGSFKSALTDTLTLVLGDDFSGVLYLALYFTYGDQLSYSIASSVPATSGSTPSPVPLPATGLLLGGALVGAGLLAKRRLRS
ncbi:hypothetical protein [Pseudoruegeria sp. HB172150]|uniref:hypothetical protein n=1 Tax=Pseudoruegeria sp. HB172150 TaxID=2721164 RepID=UPI001557DA48|nr:hypothetical protein [Pseudoruegeria sp. HB172150]